MHMGASRLVNLQRHRIAQCRSIVIRILGDEGVPVQGTSINHVGIYDLSPSPSWSLLLHKVYVVKLSFGYPPPSTVHVVYGCPPQVDGEAWLHPPGIIRILHKNRVQLVSRDKVSKITYTVRHSNLLIFKTSVSQP